MPKGSRLSRHAGEWHRVALSVVLDAQMNAQRRRILVQLVDHLAVAQHQALRTVVPVWSRLIEILKRSRSSIARYIAWLRAEGLLGLVATGRRKEYRPENTGQDHNEAAVYSLSVPLSLVEKNDTPPPGRESDNSPHAREDDEEGAATPPQPIGQAASRPEVAEALRRRRHELPSRFATRPWTRGVSRHAQRELETLVALRVQDDAHVLRQITTAHVASSIRPFIRAGWSAADIAHALHFTPSGDRYTFYAVQGVENPGAWLRARLRLWQGASGAPRRSQGQREAARADALQVARRAEREREASAPAPVARPSWFERVRNGARTGEPYKK